MPDVSIWRDLSLAEVREFVNWALDNWEPDTEPDKIWHPVIRRTWSQLDEAFANTRRQILADMEETLFIHKEEL